MCFSLDYFIGLLFICLCICACWNSAECNFFRCSWNFGQSFDSNWISISTKVLYLLTWLIESTLRASVFSMEDLTIFLSSRKVILLLYFTCNIAFSFFIDVTWSWVCQSCWLFGNFFVFQHSSSVWSGPFLLHFAHLSRPWQVSLWCPYFWHLKHLKSAKIYCSTLLKQ